MIALRASISALVRNCPRWEARRRSKSSNLRPTVALFPLTTTLGRTGATVDNWNMWVTPWPVAISKALAMRWWRSCWGRVLSWPAMHEPASRAEWRKCPASSETTDLDRVGIVIEAPTMGIPVWASMVVPAIEPLLCARRGWGHAKTAASTRNWQEKTVKPWRRGTTECRITHLHWDDLSLLPGSRKGQHQAYSAQPSL